MLFVTVLVLAMKSVLKYIHFKNQIRTCRGSSGCSSVCHLRYDGSISETMMWDLWWKMWQRESIHCKEHCWKVTDFPYLYSSIYSRLHITLATDICNEWNTVWNSTRHVQCSFRLAENSTKIFVKISRLYLFKSTRPKHAN